ncbi:hypothetical protein P691DRAFT_210439 [Macrolepiota fuliginosa MF-IS2]|uniref:Uncharacterized protein n=1 Tax=Macrolepiota fuliginosa MF-IS2 TaxID=1400762 RepID=A0A9P5XNY8_9AGAR|nr:hypothetical protein P691DRAFT_210439 [Macrolepiota fuliginosa MF-IS2]
MPGEPAVPSPKTRPVTRRSSIRQSLNLASVSKAFADVINKDKDKDNKDSSRSSKKAKDSRRLSVQAKPRTSMGDTRSPSQATVRTATPESKPSSTRRRVSGANTKSSSDELPPKPDSVNNTPKSGILTRAATLRAKNPNLAASSLPKYRPRSAASEQLKPPSPVTVRAGTRRRLDSSDEEKEDKRRLAPSNSASADKGARPISPLPQRAALKALNTTPTSTPPTPPKASAGTPTSSRGSPTRPAKTFKTSTSTSAVSRPPPSSASTIARPSSSSSSNAPQTPKTPVVKSSVRRTTQDKNKLSPSRSALRSESPSPPARHVRSRSKVDNPGIGNMSHISEGADEDEDELDDVELLLAPIARLGAPTPAMPRIQKSRSRNKPPAPPPKTPIRGVAQLPTRANMSYLSPLPPGDGESSILRPPQSRQAGGNARNAGRGSILSWEQLASEASKTLGEDEIEKMLADIPAPFRSGAASPALSATLEIPESPCLSALDSPTGYGSISQVLLPDVTPSPAMHASQRYSLSSHESTTVDSPVVNLLRLQLAQAENMGKERLMQMHAMEQEIHALKEAQARQAQETNRHIAYLEANERKGEEQTAYISSLEDRLRHAEAQRDRVIRETRRKSEESVRRSCEMERRKESVIVRAGCAARLSVSGWNSAKDLAEVELDLVRGDCAVLSVLLAELDRLNRALVS